MKNKIILLSSVALLGTLSGCDDDYSNQFNIIEDPVDVKNVTMTLSSEDYGTLAGLAENQTLASSRDTETNAYLEALQAVKSDKYFTSMAPAEDYIPAFLANKYPNADLGSKFVVTYNQYQEPSGYLADFKNISSYTLSADDYKTVWGESLTASFLSPASLNKIPALLRENVKDAESGDMVVVNYAYSSVEPSTGGGTSEVSYTPIAEVIANTSGGDYVVKGEVVATYARGFLLNDGTAGILVYLNKTANYSVGDVVTVSGTTSQYSGLMQFPATSEVAWVERNASFAYPAPEKLDGVALDAYMSKPSLQYASVTGKLVISGNYYNLEVEGATRQGSISYPVGGIVDKELNDKNVTVTGYLIGGSSKFVNVMATSVVAEGEEPATTPIGVVALASTGDYTVSGTVAAIYNNGFLVTDGTGSVLVYKKGTEAQIGDVVTVSGAVSMYAGFAQFSSACEVEIVSEGKFTWPDARVLDTDALEAYLTTPFIGYITYEGTLSISGNYYNVIIDGSSSVQGSLSYPVAGSVDPELNGQRVQVTGYAIGVTGGKYVNTMVTSVQAATESRSAVVFSRAAGVSANASVLYVYDGAGWGAYTSNDARVAVVDPGVYASLGATSISNPDHVLPIYLQRTYPYAEEGDKVVVVYNKTADTPTFVEYTFGGTWAATPAYVPATTTFMKEAEGISANMSVFINETFLGDEGGFTTQNVTLSGLTYIWSNTTLYGWKASGYANGGQNVTEGWLVSPLINLKKAKEPMMTFEEVHQYGTADPSNELFVMISENYKGDVTTCDWTALQVPNWSTGSDWNFVSVGLIDLADYVGKEVVIAFKYTSSSEAAATWEVKNLMVAEKTELEK